MNHSVKHLLITPMLQRISHTTLQTTLPQQRWMSIKPQQLLFTQRRFMAEGSNPHPPGQSYNPYAQPAQNVVSAAQLSQTASLPPTAASVTPALPTKTSSTSWVKQNPWFLPYVLTTTPMAGFLVYQQLIINEIVHHTKALEDAVEQFSSIMEYHHSLLGEIIDFPDDQGQDEGFDGELDLPPRSGSNSGIGPQGGQGRGFGGQQQQLQIPPPPPQDSYQPRSAAFAAATGRPPQPPQGGRGGYGSY